MTTKKITYDDERHAPMFPSGYVPVHKGAAETFLGQNPWLSK